jgi:hypothetical protein
MNSASGYVYTLYAQYEGKEQKYDCILALKWLNMCKLHISVWSNRCFKVFAIDKLKKRDRASFFRILLPDANQFVSLKMKIAEKCKL